MSLSLVKPMSLSLVKPMSLSLVKPMSLSSSIHDHHTLIRQDTILSPVTKSSRDEWDLSRIIAVVSHFITSLKIK